jgi:hypothetical protein
MHRSCESVVAQVRPLKLSWFCAHICRTCTIQLICLVLCRLIRCTRTPAPPTPVQPYMVRLSHSSALRSDGCGRSHRRRCCCARVLMVPCASTQANVPRYHITRRVCTCHRSAYCCPHRDWLSLSRKRWQGLVYLPSAAVTPGAPLSKVMKTARLSGYSGGYTADSC